MVAPSTTNVIPIVVSCINMAVTMLQVHNAAMETTHAKLALRKKTKQVGHYNGGCSTTNADPEYGIDGDELQHPHENELIGLLAWHIEVLDAKWYVKPRSTCWFDEYLFEIYTPDMFYDILRMRRTTFDKLVRDLRPFIQGQHTH